MSVAGEEALAIDCERDALGRITELTDRGLENRGADFICIKYLLSILYANEIGCFSIKGRRLYR